jgi:hypothetical protein
MNKGEIYYYIYIKSSNPENNVIAFTPEIQAAIPRETIDYTSMIRRNIIQKSSTIFQAMGWETMGLIDSKQSTLL